MAARLIAKWQDPVDEFGDLRLVAQDDEWVLEWSEEDALGDVRWNRQAEVPAVSGGLDYDWFDSASDNLDLDTVVEGSIELAEEQATTRMLMLGIAQRAADERSDAREAFLSGVLSTSPTRRTEERDDVAFESWWAKRVAR